MVYAALLSMGAAAAAPPFGSPPGDAPPGGPLDPGTRVLDTRDLTGLDRLIDALKDRRAIFVGETHDRYEDHLIQLAIVDGLLARGVKLGIGMEMFQQPYQGALDDYVAGRIDESEMLHRTQYFDRWRFDYRLYRPVLGLARERGIPLIALNLPSELTSKVGRSGIESLSKEERAEIPAKLDRSDPAYVERIRDAYRMHPAGTGQGFETFLEVQLLWDEGMAERAAVWLEGHPDRTLVVLAGAGHIEYGQGIPRRLTRRIPVATATVLDGRARDLDPDAADYLVFPQSRALPPAGLLGVMTSPAGGEPRGCGSMGWHPAAGLNPQVCRQATGYWR